MALPAHTREETASRKDGPTSSIGPPAGPPDVSGVSSRHLRAAERATALEEAHLQQLLSSNTSIDFSSLSLPSPTTVTSALASFFSSLHALRAHAAQLPSLHLSTFERSILSNLLLINPLPLSTVHQKEAALLQRQSDKRQQRTRTFIEQLKRLCAIESEELSKVDERWTEVEGQLKLDAEAMDAAAREMQPQQVRAMRKVANRLRAIASAQRAVVEAAYGRLTKPGYLTLPSLSALSSLRSLLPSPSLSRPPRVLSVTVSTLRAIKDKLPAGSYSLLITVLPCLTSLPLPHARVLQQRRAHSQWIQHFDFTRTPQRHSGKYYATELSFSGADNEMHVAVPSKEDSTMGLCLLIELIALVGSEASVKVRENGVAGEAKRVQRTAYDAYYRTDCVVAFGYLPLVDPITCELATGKVKLPLLRGDHRTDYAISTYQQITDAFTDSLDRWLCNAYVDLASSVPQRRSGYWVVDGDHSDRTSALLREERRRRDVARQLQIDAKAKRAMREQEQSSGWMGFLKGIRQSPAATATSTSTSGAARGVAGKIDFIGRSIEEMANSAEGKEMHKRRQMRDKVKQLRQYRHSTLPHNRVHLHLLPVRDARALLLSFTVREVANHLRYKRGQELTTLLHLVLFLLAFFVRLAAHFLSQYVVLTRVLQFNVERVNLSYPWRATFTYDTSQYDGYQLASWQWLVCVGSSFGCSLAALFLCALYAALRRLMPVPDLFYAFGLFYAGHCVLDPLYVVVIDAVGGWWTVDEYALLFQHWAALQSAYAALLLLLPLLALLALTPLLTLLLYLTRVHHQPHLTDLFLRLHQPDAALHLPRDLEVPLRLVRTVLRDSAQWRGTRGGRRRVMVNQYQRTQGGGLERGVGVRGGRLVEEAVHVSVWNVTHRRTVERERGGEGGQGVEGEEVKEEGGKGEERGEEGVDVRKVGREVEGREGKESMVEERELYRHFLRLSDGAWVECLDGVEAYGGDMLGQREVEWVEEEERKRRGRGEEEERLRAEEEEEQREREERDRKERQRSAESAEAGRVRTAPRGKGGAEGERPQVRKGSLRNGVVREEEKEGGRGREKDGRTLRWEADEKEKETAEERHRAMSASLFTQTIAEDEEEEEEEEEKEGGRGARYRATLDGSGGGEAAANII